MKMIFSHKTANMQAYADLSDELLCGIFYFDCWKAEFIVTGVLLL